jgi:transketolase
MTKNNGTTYSPTRLENLSINTIRFLSVDAVQKANSGHPGLPMDAAPMAYILWTRFLKHNPSDPNWFDRDRFVLSAGHGSMLLYSLLYLTGYNLSLDQIKNFRQWGSITPGHPESELTPGVETTTGPLGQGFGNGVGMAIAEAHLAKLYNRPGHTIVNHYTYGIVSDGDMMEGASSEAASLAGHLKLGKLIYLYDSNHISLAASTQVTFTEDVVARFEAYGWHTQKIADGNDLEAINRAIQAARMESDRPSLILVRTHIGYGSPNKQDTYAAHGSPLGEEEVKLTKENMGWPLEPAFYVPEPALKFYRQALSRGQKYQSAWEERFQAYQKSFPDLAKEFSTMMKGDIPASWEKDLPAFNQDDAPMATRVASGKIMNAIAPKIPALVGGSADLAPSTHTDLSGMGDFEDPSMAEGDMQGSFGGGWSYAGRNLHFGVREHAMGTILNGMASHGGILPFGGTFLVFSDYMRPPIRLAALMRLHVIYVFTHDSIGLGEDGPTHQPVEQLLSLRAIPNLTVIRPADANETVAAWQVAVTHKQGPVALVFTRQKLPILDIQEYPQISLGVQSGGYILADASNQRQPDISLVATGSEVHLALDAYAQLLEQGIHAQVVSLPSWNLFQNQPEDYRRQVLPAGIPILTIEAGVSLGWKSYVGAQNEMVDTISVDTFGASAPGEVVMDHYGFNIEHVVERSIHLLNRSREIASPVYSNRK